jgi:hypothetical protein
MKIGQIILTVVGAGLLLAPGGAFAAQVTSQNAAVAESFFGRDRNTSVRQRSRPDYEAIGVHTGGLTWYPRISGEVEYNDNIYASALKVDDVIAHIRPEVGVRSNWSRHSIGGYARANFNRYADNKGENSEEYAVGAQGRLDFARASNLYAGVDQQWLIEPRTAPTSPAAAAKPTEYALSQANVGFVHELTRVRVSARVDYSDFNYENNVTRAGTPLIQDDRDREVVTVSGRAEYAYSPATAVFVAVKGNRRSYKLAPPASAVNRDSEGYAATAGVNFDVSNLIRGEVEAGYMRQSYDDPGFRDGVHSFAAAGRLEWFPTELTTVTLSGVRSIEEATVPGAQGFVSSSVAVQVDHELLRNLLLGAQASYTGDRYKGVDRKDSRTSAGVSATYLMNHRAAVSLNYSYLQQASSGLASTSDYSVNRIAGSLILQF